MDEAGSPFSGGHAAAPGSRGSRLNESAAGRGEWWGTDISDVYVDVAGLTPELRERLAIPSCCAGSQQLLLRCGACVLVGIVLPFALLACASPEMGGAQDVLVALAVVLLFAGCAVCLCSVRRACCEGVFDTPDPVPPVPPLCGKGGFRSTSVRKALLIYNPNAGKCLAETLCHEYVIPGLRARGVETTAIQTQHCGHAREIAMTSALGEFDAMICVGGDGTFHEMINGMLAREDGQRVPVTLVPLGSGNGVAATLRQSMRRGGAEVPIWSELEAVVEWSLDRVAGGRLASADLLEVTLGGRRLVSVMQIFLGMMGEVDILAEPFRWLGPVRLDLLSLWSVLKKGGRSFAYEVTLADGSSASREHEALGVNVGLTQHWTDGMRGAPQAQLDDGLAELNVLSSKTSVDNLLANFLKIPLGAHEFDESDRITGISFDLGAPGVVNIDGEIFEHDGKLDIRVLPQHLEVLVGKDEVEWSASPAEGDVGTSGACSAHPHRWRMLGIYCLGSMAVQAIWISFAPVQADMVALYSVSERWVDWMSLSFMVAYVPLTFPASYAMDVSGCRVALLLGNGLNLVGAALRCVTPLGGASSITLVTVGQILSACAQPFFTNMPPKLAKVWFPCHQRALADTIASLSMTVGVAIGFLLPTSFGIQNMLYIQFGWSLVSAILTFACFSSAPPSPPGLVAERPHTAFWSEVKMAMRNRRFLCLLIAFSCGLGSFNTISTLAGALTAPWGFSTDDASNFGVYTVVAGIVGAAVMTTVIGYTKKYRTALLACLGLGTLFCALVAGSVCSLGTSGDGVAIASLAFAGLGFSAIPVMPVAFEAAVEAAKPTGEGTLAGLCMTGGNLLGAIFTVLAEAVLQMPSYAAFAWAAALLLFGMALVAVFCYEDEGIGFRSLPSKAAEDGFSSADESKGLQSRTTASVGALEECMLRP